MSVCVGCGKDFDATASGPKILCPDCWKKFNEDGLSLREILEKSAKKPKAAVMGGIKDSGERKIGIYVPERYYVRCASCGFTLSGWSQSAASAIWNRQSKKVRT